MAGLVDGFSLKLVRRSLAAERRHNGQLIDTVPVSWASSWRQGPPPSKKEAEAKAREAFVAIPCKDADELERRMSDPTPFVVALAGTKDKRDRTEAFAGFHGVFEVASTGVALSPDSFEARVIRRVRPESLS